MDTTDLFDEDKYGDWCEIRGVFAMKTGGFGALNAWCDTTGWDCQSGGTWTDCKTEEEAYVFARK